VENTINVCERQEGAYDGATGGVKTKVMLLSATPVNNNLKDLRNQIYFVTEGRDNEFSESFGIRSLKDTLAAAQRTFTEWAKKSGEKRCA
jgi:hypothetical protein